MQIFGFAFCRNFFQFPWDGKRNRYSGNTVLWISVQLQVHLCNGVIIQKSNFKAQMLWKEFILVLWKYELLKETSKIFFLFYLLSSSYFYFIVFRCLKFSKAWFSKSVVLCLCFSSGFYLWNVIIVELQEFNCAKENKKFRENWTIKYSLPLWCIKNSWKLITWNALHNSKGMSQSTSIISVTFSNYCQLTDVLRNVFIIHWKVEVSIWLKEISIVQKL